MARKSPLRAVTSDETAARVVPSTVTQAASEGTTRDLLVTMRDRVAKDVENENTPARDLAALTKRLMEIVRDIEAIDARTEQEAGKRGPVGDGTYDASAI